ncbi:MAG: AfsR/SARP family transcriptional regulator, partial [Pseudonocardia sp.]
GADRAATATLVALCAGVPLALRIAATHMAQRPGIGIAEYVEQARAQGTCAVLHMHGDVVASMMAVFHGSYGRLAPELRRLLRLLGELPVAEFGPDETARHAGVTAPDALAGLEALAAVSLLKRLPGGRYQMLRLLRSCVREQHRRDVADARSASLVSHACTN